MHGNTKELSVFFADYYSTKRLLWNAVLIKVIWLSIPKTFILLPQFTWIRPKAKFFASISLCIPNYFKLIWAIFVEKCARNAHQSIVVRRDSIRIRNIYRVIILIMSIAFSTYFFVL